jgi:hypothetical protein
LNPISTRPLAAAERGQRSGAQRGAAPGVQRRNVMFIEPDSAVMTSAYRAARLWMARGVDPLTVRAGSGTRRSRRRTSTCTARARRLTGWIGPPQPSGPHGGPQRGHLSPNDTVGMRCATWPYAWSGGCCARWSQYASNRTFRTSRLSWVARDSRRQLQYTVAHVVPIQDQ